METKAALVRTNCGVELNTEAAVNLNLAAVIYPRNTELNNTLGLNHALDNAACNILGALLENGLDRLKNLTNGLMELGLTGISFFNGSHKLVKII
jgi:hypothetical protein